MSDNPGRGHNLPSLAKLLPIETVKAAIAAEIEPLRQRADELIGSCKRFSEAYPTIPDDEADAKAAEILAVVQRFTSKSGRVETARVALKAPIQAADTAIGSLAKGPFAGVVTSVLTAAASVERASINYKVGKERAAREATQAEAKRKADEAALTEKLAARGRTSYDEAAAAAQAADDAQKAASATAATLTRTHGDQAGVTSLKYKRVATIINPGLVERRYCVPSQSLIDEAKGKPGTPIPVIAGVVIEDVPDLTVRR